MGARRPFDPRTRDAALRRLRRLTAATAAAATALAGVFAGLAASSLPGRKGGRVAQRPSIPLPQAHRAVRRARAATHVAASVPAATTPAPATPAPSPAPAPAPPPAAPAPTPAPPVVVSGGS